MAKWIQGAVNPARKGVEQRAAARAGMSTHAYKEQHKDDPGAAGARARLGLRLEGMHHEPAVKHADRNRK